MRICTCNRGGEWENRTGLVRNDMGLEICSHCGGVVPPEGSSSLEFQHPTHVIGIEDFSDFDSDYVDPYQKYYRKAKKCSKKGEHSEAIGFYKKSFEKTWYPGEKCKALAAIADEYETMGDYALAEEYWDRCLAVENLRPESIYKYIARKGDFLYRRNRYGEAIEAYDESFKVLNGLDEAKMHYSKLKIYVRLTHFIIDSYGKLGEDNHEEKYHRILKHGVNRYIRSRSSEDVEVKAHYISEMAWTIFNDEGWSDEALLLIDSAIELHPDCPANYYNIKAIILKYKFRYEEALKYYDLALSKAKSNKTLLKNRAECEAECIKYKLEIDVTLNWIKPHHLELNNKALKILPKEYDNSPYLNVKAEILDQLGEPVKAWICRCLAGKDYETVDKVEKQLKKMKSGGTYINITGIHFYQGFEPFKEGTIVDLIREPDNPHDSDAIRVEVDGETVGYVANGRHTAIKEVSSATDIKDEKSTQAEVQFILFRKWVIAKLI